MDTNRSGQGPAALSGDGRSTAQIERLERSLVELNERIARLAISLDMRLDSDAAVQDVLDRRVGRWSSPGGAVIPARATVGAHPVEHAWEELRGLLNMRCDLMSRALQDLGLEASRELARLVEEDVRHDGFAPDADGFRMNDWLNPPKRGE